jgi:hypothetical protein
MTDQELRELQKRKADQAARVDYYNKYKAVAETDARYKGLSAAQQKLLTAILIADSLTADQMRDDPIYKNFSIGAAQKVEDEVIITTASSATLKALAKKGIIEILDDGGMYTDRIKFIRQGAEV